MKTKELNKQSEIVSIKYKTKKTIVPMCPRCENNVLAGNNSLAMPYMCFFCKIKLEPVYDKINEYIIKPL